MTLSDLAKLIRHYLKLVIAVPVVCVVITAVIALVAPQDYEAKSTLLTNGDVSLVGGYAQSEAEAFSQNGIEVSTATDVAYRTTTVIVEGNDRDACIAAANATVRAAAEDVHAVAPEYAISTNEAATAENVSPSILKLMLIALLVGLFLSLCVVILIDAIKKPIKSKSEVETLLGLPVIGMIPNRDRGERLLANVRFSSDETPTSVAIVPAGLTGATLACAELANAFEHSGTAVCRVKGNPHAESIGNVSLPGIVSIVECSPISEGMGAVYIAKEADMTILCIREWLDSRKALTSIAEELKFAKANTIGAIFLTSK